MRVMLVSVTPVVQGCRALGLPSDYNGAGWIEGIIDCLSDRCELSVLFLNYGISGIQKAEFNGVTYIAIPTPRKGFHKIMVSGEVADNLARVREMIMPDVVHMFGTETPFTQTVINVMGNDKVVVHLTGLVSYYAMHYFGGLDRKDIRSTTFRDLIKGGVVKGKKNFQRNAEFEQSAISVAKYVMGRTTWDKACILQINPNVRYYKCNEILRAGFYGRRWNTNQYKKHTIFVGSGNCPLKGVHQVIQALPIIKKEYPNVEVYIAGNNIIRRDTWRDKLAMTSYGRYVRRMINKYGLEDNVHFVGPQNAGQMVERYLAANVFVLPSNIENSPNSLGEAMLLGLPCVASFVGGVQDLLKDKEEGFLYPFDEPYMLAHYVMEFFRNEALAVEMGENAANRAAETHNKERITSDLIAIYRDILEG